MEAIRSINTKNFELSQVQTNILKVLRILASKDIVDGVLLSGVQVGTDDTPIAHMLGRKPVGYIIVGKNGPGDIYQTGSNSLNLILKSTAAVTAEIWAF
jgi:hypothetical protein